MFAMIETLEELSAADVRALHPETSFPPEFGAECLEPFGIAPISFEPPPTLQDGETLEAGGLRRDGGRIVREWAVIPAPLSDWPAVIADRRYQAEIAGCDVAGMRVDTDDRSKLLINGAVVEAMLDPAYTLAWKTSAGVVPLTGEQVIGVGRAVRAHVQACFDRESELMTALAAGTFTPDMLDQGWPS